MSKKVVFTGRSFKVTKNVVITNADLDIPENIYDNIMFSTDIQITVVGSVSREELEDEFGIELVKKAKIRIMPCNIKWHGFHNSLSTIKCNKECHESGCVEFIEYKDYIKNKNLLNIAEFKKLVYE